jgi:hypothetical protein
VAADGRVLPAGVILPDAADALQMEQQLQHLIDAGLKGVVDGGMRYSLLDRLQASFDPGRLQLGGVPWLRQLRAALAWQAWIWEGRC